MPTHPSPDHLRFEAVFASAPVGMALVRADGRVLRANAPLRELWGGDPVGRHLDDLLYSEDLATEHEQLARLVGGELTAITLELRVRTAQGHVVPARFAVSIVRDPGGRPVEYVVQLVDISEPARLREQARHEADHDPLTGTYNRRAFTRLLDHHVSYARRYRRDGALLVFDVDGLREINQAYGHSAGDGVLEAVARVIGERMRDTDLMGRIGDGEFGVLLHEIDLEGARRVATSLARAASERAIDVAGARGKVHLTVSAAIVVFGEETVSSDELLNDAAAALLEAKGAGRGRSVVSSRGVGGQRRTWADKVRSSLEADAFLLDAQPIVDAVTGEAVQYELLLRMRDDDGTVVRPMVFLGAAERHGLMRAVDEWVVRRAVALARARIEIGEPVQLAVNLSGESVGDRSFLPLVVDELLAAPAVGAQLIFEITERTAVSDLEQAKRLIARLGEFGCRISLDDFGTGAGGLHYLKHLPVEFLKLDGEFTRTLPDNPLDHQIVGAVVQAAAGLGKTVVAECVEDEEILEAVRSFGIPLVQGLHVGRPAPAGELLAVLRR